MKEDDTWKKIKNKFKKLLTKIWTDVIIKT